MKTGILTALALAVPASAANVYVFSSGDEATDRYLMSTLTGCGHTATLGVQFMNFDGTISLAGYQAVYLQASANWSAGELPAAGALQLRNWVDGGGRLVTSEWVTYYSTPGEAFAGISTLLPLVPSTNYGSNPTTTFRMATPDPVINLHMPPTFEMPLVDFVGTEIYTVAKTGATTYYTTAGGTQYAGLAGWHRGSGSVYSFSTTGGWLQLSTGYFCGLLCNLMGPVAAPCYPNCDGSTAPPIVNIADFVCFMERFSSGNSYANCDGSTTPPVLTVNDFICFQTRYAAGCQ
jgi:hypothetical protein